jgi:hypothetical protein
MKILIPIATLGAALLLSACASSAPMVRAQSYEGRSEKALLAVLRNVKADDAQRTAVLAAYDRHNPSLTRLAEEWDQIEKDWAELDRRADDFTAKAAALAQRRQQIAAQQMIDGAAFERDVAALLTPEQWTDWQELWDLVGAPEACGPGGPGRRRR